MTPLRRRHRLGLRAEFALVLLPTLCVLLVLAFMEHVGRQRLLFASLASSAFLIYLDPSHAVNAVRTVVLSQLSAAVVGAAACAGLGDGYAAAGISMVAIISLMLLLDMMHPPAVSTALSFGIRSSDVDVLAMFGLAVGMIAALVILQKLMIWLLYRLLTRSRKGRVRDA